MAYQNLGREKLMGVCNALKDVAASEGDPKMEGRMMGIVLAPSRKKAPAKVVAPAKPKEAATGTSSNAAAAAENAPPKLEASPQS
jgi:hypothetical protein